MCKLQENLEKREERASLSRRRRLEFSNDKRKRRKKRVLPLS